LQQVLLEIVNNPTTRDLLRQTLAPEVAPTLPADSATASETVVQTRKAPEGVIPCPLQEHGRRVRRVGFSMGSGRIIDRTMRVVVA